MELPENDKSLQYIAVIHLILQQYTADEYPFSNSSFISFKSAFLIT